MFYRRVRVQLITRVLLIVAAALLTAYLVGWTDFYVAWGLAGGLVVYLTYSLIRYAEKTTRDLTRFLEATPGSPRRSPLRSCRASCRSS